MISVIGIIFIMASSWWSFFSEEEVPAQIVFRNGVALCFMGML